MRRFVAGVVFWLQVAAIVGFAWPAFGQQANVYYQTGPFAYQAVSAGTPLPVTGSFSATTVGFPGTTQTTGTPISVTTGGVTGTLPAGTVVTATNVGTTNTAYCKLGASATTSDQAIFPNSWFAFTVGSNTQLTCITSTSTTTVNMVGGAGLPTGAGGGGTTSSVAIAQGGNTALVKAGNTAAAGDQALVVSDPNVLSAVQSPIPAQGNRTTNIGTVDGGVNVTLTDCSGTVVTGGTAVNAFTAQTTLHGFVIANTDTSEVMWISFTTTAQASTAGSYPLAPATATTFAGLSSFASPFGMGTNHALSVVAATSAHKFSCTWW